MIDILTKEVGGACSYTPDSKFDFHEFELNFECVTNGDDNVISVSEHYVPLISQFTMADALAEIGMRYTDAQKSGVMISHRKITEVQFLKRMFVYDINYCRWIAPLELASILEAPYWKTRGGTDKDLATCVEQSLGELSFHGDSVYTPTSVLIIDACVRNGVSIPSRTSWESVYAYTLNREALY